MNNVKDFGAIGNGIANDTAAIQRAIDAGGTVYFPAGTYRTGSIYLKSNGGLELDHDATILASTDPADYSQRNFCQQEYNSNIGKGNHAHLVIALEQENIFIHGGKFNGNGKEIYANPVMSDAFNGGPDYETPKWWTQQLLFFCESKDIRLSDFTIEDSTCWGCFLHGCENVNISRVNVFNSPYMKEDDGIDIDCCSHVTVSDCIINVGDDALTLRGANKNLKNPRPCEWITISNCILRSAYAHAIRVGVGSGVIRHCLFNNIAVHDSHTAVHINSKYSENGDGVDISDVAFRNMHINTEQLTLIRLDYKFVKEATCRKAIRDIVFSNIDGHVSLPSQIWGNDTGTIEGITFENIHLKVNGKLEPTEKIKLFLMLQRLDGAFLLEKARDITFNNVTLKYEHPEVWEHDIAPVNCSDIKIHNCIFPHDEN